MAGHSLRAALQVLLTGGDAGSSETRIDLAACLRDPRAYERQIERLHERHLFTRQLYTLEQDGVSLATLVLHRAQIGKLLARTVSGGRYLFDPAALREIRVEGKPRTVYAFRLTDQIVVGLVADLLEQMISPSLSPRVFSYRKGFSWLQPVTDFARYVRMHRRARPDPRESGLYVLRRDIEAYFDSIPVGRDSLLWDKIRSLGASAGSGGSFASNEWCLLEKVIRPEVRFPDGALASRFRGVPTGQPIASVVANLYLADLDRELEAIPGAFYARYADDLIFAHPNPTVAQDVDRRIDHTLDRLQLAVNEDKRQTLFLNAAGRTAHGWPEPKGRTAIPLLGMLILANGSVALGRRKARRLLGDLEVVVQRTVTALPQSDRERLGRTVCAVINRVLAPHATVFQQRSIPLLLRAVTDRGQLAHLDYCIARIVLRAVTRQRGVRAFRTLPYRKMREQWGLVSLLHTRNRWRSA